MRGDVDGRVRPIDLMEGSPPRARGRHGDSGELAVERGLTPACAGTSTYACSSLLVGTGSPPRARGRPTRPLARRPRWRAHPRVRGDVALQLTAYGNAEGSPPRARGRRVRWAQASANLGLTPACAGTSGLTRRPGLSSRAHPRVRGDVHLYRGVALRRIGLTPACAGTSKCRPCPQSLVGAHPRVRGDVTARHWSVLLGAGSPPRARGRHRPSLVSPARRGLTPACAGTSGAWIGELKMWRAHPRVRGDVPRHPTAARRRLGSPPRARGRRHGHDLDRPHRGLTPACAGTSRTNAAEIATRRAHPRVRGDVFGLRPSQAYD